MGDKKYGIFITIISLIFLIVILEIFFNDSTSNNNSLEMTTKEIYTKSYKRNGTNIDIQLYELKSNNRNAVLINEQIEERFLKKSKKIFEDRENYKGRYEVTSEYTQNGSIFSMKIFLSEHTDTKDDQEVFCFNYDVDKNVSLGLFNIINDRDINYDDLLEKVIKKQKDIIEDIVYSHIENCYIDKQNRLVLVISNIVKKVVDGKEKYIEVYSFYTVDKK